MGTRARLVVHIFCTTMRGSPAASSDSDEHAAAEVEQEEATPAFDDQHEAEGDEVEEQEESPGGDEQEAPQDLPAAQPAAEPARRRRTCWGHMVQFEDYEEFD